MEDNSNIKILVLRRNNKGELANMYSPLQNLVSESTSLIGDMTTKKLEFDRYTPVDMSISDEYDGSNNIIINDDKTNPKLINTRFSVQENNTYNIPEHFGNFVTNIYDESTFGVDTQLLKLYKNIPSLYFEGLYNGGSFPCGSYVFYFKFSDADGNLTNTVQESGIVLIHIGLPGSKKIRMGMENENSQKCIKFKLSDIDSGFDYVKIFYERVSTDESQARINRYFMIDQNFPITDNTCEILLTGSEPTIECVKSDLNNEFADIQTVKTLAIVDSTLFLGNISACTQNYQELLSIAWSITPEIVEGANIGSISCNEYLTLDSALYYDLKNAYYYTGYWPDEIYRFGIVFIYNNNLLSPVFNLQGCDLEKLENKISNYNQGINSNDSKKNIKDYYLDEYGKRHKSEPENYFFDIETLQNSKGVFKFPKLFNYNESRHANVITPKILAIKFNINNIAIDSETPIQILRKNNIKGFFFVRQKRIPTIITQGLVIGLTGKDHGSIPVLLNTITKKYNTKSFLNKNRILDSGSTVDIITKVEQKALLVPDYEIDTPTLNLFFTSKEFYLDRIGKTSLKWYGDSCVIQSINKPDPKAVLAKLTAVQKETKIITDGENYFSSMAGVMNEPYKTADVNLVWNKTVPQNLTVSTSLIRGNWGSYVGMSTNEFDYGDVINIKIPECANDDWEILEFLKRFKDFSFYSAISPRKSIESIFNTYNSGILICYRGDCYFNVFTHRMMSNFIDGELPTNRKIVDPGCWASNYGVRCTAEILSLTHSNLTDDSDGWYIPSPLTRKSSIVSLIFGILTLNIGIIIQASTLLNNSGSDISLETFANEIVLAFEVSIDVTSEDTVESICSSGKIKKVNPKEQESQGGLNLKAIFKSDDGWELRGLASINRADVNAVSFGQWITFPICSNYNLALRDIDFSHATEEASLNLKRAFYPWEEMNVENHLLESEVINGAAKRTLSSNGYPAFTTVPYIKQEFFNRIYWSKPNVSELFINSYRMIFKDQYREYNKEFGAITKIIPMQGSLLVVFQHGIGVLPVNRTPLSDQEKSPYLSSKSVLPTQVQTISRDYGSMWKDSVLQTPSGIVYGVDTVAKKIWRTNGLNLEFISDHKMSKFLNDWIDLSEYDFNEYAGHINVKTHYNEFKHDVMFTYYKDTPMTEHEFKLNPITEEYDIVPIGSTGHNRNGNWIWIEPELKHKAVPVDLSGNLVLEDTLDPRPLIDFWEKGKTWNLCYNEVLQLWTTFYDWYPIESCNVDNIFFSFDKEAIDEIYEDNYTRPDALSGSGLSGYRINKVFADKMFTENVNAYILKPGDSVTVSKPLNLTVGDEKKCYLSLYYKGTNPLSNPIDEISLGKDSDWKFTYEESDSETFSLVNSTDNTYIIDCHFTAIKQSALTLNDPVLKLQELRTLEGPQLYLWKHGQAGLYDNQGKIKPTHWYGKLHEFNVEFVVNQDAQILKIFNNLKIISNKTAPNKFEYEIVGEGYDWFDLKPVVLWINKKCNDLYFLNNWYKEVLSKSYGLLRSDYIDFPELFGYKDSDKIKKLPFLRLETCDKYGRLDKSYHLNTDFWDSARAEEKKIPKTKDVDYTFNTSEVILVEDDQLHEQRVHTEQLGNDVRKYGRLRGNMQYLEDLWDIEIRPIKFNWAYMNGDELTFAPSKEARHRDKYIKVKVRYSGEDLAVIQGIITMFDYSMA